MKALFQTQVHTSKPQTKCANCQRQLVLWYPHQISHLTFYGNRIMKWNVLWNTILTQWVWTEVETAWNSKSWWILALGHSHYALCFSDAGHSCGQRKEMSPAMDWTELVVLAVNVHSPLWGLLSLRWSAEVMDVELQYYTVPIINTIG